MNYKYKLGKEIELTDERNQHILTFHPELEKHFDKFSEVLLDPDDIRVSPSDSSVLLFHKSFASIGTGKYLRIAVKINGRWFIVTAYLTKRLVGKVYEY